MFFVFTFGTTQNTTKTVQYKIVKNEIIGLGAVSTNDETWKACKGMVWSGLKLLMPSGVKLKIDPIEKCLPSHFSTVKI